MKWKQEGNKTKTFGIGTKIPFCRKQKGKCLSVFVFFWKNRI